MNPGRKKGQKKKKKKKHCWHLENNYTKATMLLTWARVLCMR
jgi:hypothetical protein